MRHYKNTSNPSRIFYEFFRFPRAKREREVLEFEYVITAILDNSVKSAEIYGRWPLFVHDSCLVKKEGKKKKNDVSRRAIKFFMLIYFVQRQVRKFTLN